MVSFDGGSASKVDDVTPLPSRHKMADMCYYGNVILHLQQYSHRLNLFFLSLRKLNIKSIFLETMLLMLPNDINLSCAKKCIKFINSQIAGTGRQATPN